MPVLVGTGTGAGTNAGTGGTSYIEFYSDSTVNARIQILPLRALAAASSAAAAMAPQQIAGLSFDAHSPTSLLAYVATTVVVNSVFPLPLAGPLLTVAVVLYGVVPGFVLNLCAAVVGCCLTLVLTRSCLRPHFIRLLGEHAEVWHSLDGAIVEQGAMIPLLFRLTPAAPVVLANVGTRPPRS